MRRLMGSVLGFYGDVLHVPFSRLSLPQDMHEQVAEGDRAETVKLLALLLGVAVHCEAKETHVQNLMAMDEAVKTDLSVVIKNLPQAANTAGKRAKGKKRRKNVPMIGCMDNSFYVTTQLTGGVGQRTRSYRRLSSGNRGKRRKS